MLFARGLNLRLNSFQLGGHDTTQLVKQMTKDTKDNSNYDQHSRQGPTKYRKDLSRRRIGHRPEHQKFFLLVVLEAKMFVNKLGSLWGPNRKNKLE